MKNILLVDDHPFILDTYVKMLRKIIIYKFEKFIEATNVENAVAIIDEVEKIDIAFFDISMPKKGISDMEDGIDLALYFKSKHPNAKIVFITMHAEFHILLKAIHLVSPEVFISKNEVDNFTFNSVLEAIENDKLFYSEEMLDVYKWAKRSQIKLDVYDFNRCTGLFSNQRHIEYDSLWGAGLSFSPNSRYLYLSMGLGVLQYDIQEADLKKSEINVYTADSTGAYISQLAPDEKIYICPAGGAKRISVINKPNNKGMLCEALLYPEILPKSIMRSFPYFPNFRQSSVNCPISTNEKSEMASTFSS